MLAERIDEARAARALRVAGLYAVTPELDDTEALVAKVGAAIAGGASIVQYRSKTSDAKARQRDAQSLARCCAERRVLFVVNDDARLARDVGADGVHLGEDDGSIEGARALIGPDRLIGVSCYDDLRRARDAIAAGADYVAFGSFFPSTIKPGARRASVDLLAQARALRVPVVAIGGITATNAPTLIEAGASAVAVISDVFAHESLHEVTRAAAAIARCFPARR